MRVSKYEPHIVINSDRTIVVPDKLKHIAVQFDHKVETVTFDCPRYWDNHDFSKMHAYINYMRQDGYKDQYPATNMRVDDSDETVIHFEWTISKNVTLLKGNVSFLVCIKNAEDDEPHWNSRLNQDLIIDEGMECTEYVAESNPDIIEDILSRMEVLELSGGAVTNEQIASAVEDYMAEHPVTCGGLTAELKTALVNYYTHVMPAFDDTNGLAYINAILTALGAETRVESGGDTPDIPDEPDEPDEPDIPDVTATSISATYSGGDVTVGTAVNDLTGIVVTAHFSDGSTSPVNGYTLSGTIVEGKNTITVSYGGKTTTFTVTGIAEESETNDTRELIMRTLSGTYVNDRVETVGERAFYNCKNLTAIDLPVVNSLGTKVFENCQILTTIILRSETMCTASDANTLKGCPAGESGSGYLYVPSALVETYKADSMWSKYANQFRAIEDYPEICGGE